MTLIADNDVIKFESNGERFALHIQHDSFAGNPRSFEANLDRWCAGTANTAWAISTTIPARQSSVSGSKTKST